MDNYISIEEIRNISDKIKIEIIYAEKDIRYINSITIPEHIGVYIITLKSRERYIGSSINIYKRLMSHPLRYKIIESIDIYLTENINDAKILERWFICELNPELNMYLKRKTIKKKRTKTIIIGDNLHEDLKKVQFILHDKYDLKMNLSDILYFATKKMAKLIVEELRKEQATPNA